MSFVDDGLTFGTNTKAGMCVHFRDKVPSTLGLKGYSALTVTVVDLDGLVHALGQSRVSPEPGAPCLGGLGGLGGLGVCGSASAR